MHDALCRESIEARRGTLVAWWIMAAWAYEAAQPIISDAMFDEVARRLTEEWDSIEHPHKALLDRDALKSALAIGGRWPSMAIGAARSLMAGGRAPRKRKVTTASKEDTDVIATLELDMDAARRQRITERLSQSMGAYIMSVGNTDFAGWSGDQWDQLVAIAFDVAAVEVFKSRIIVVPPVVEERPEAAEERAAA